MSGCSFIPMGRMGNFLFEAATCLAYSLEHKLEFSTPFSTTSPKGSPIYLHHLQNKEFDHWKPQVRINEEQFHHYDLPFYESMREGKNFILVGYFQSYKRFEPYRNEILKAFNFPYEMNGDTCSVHARFGDYLTIPGKHILVNEVYLRHAMNLIELKTGIKKFKVFSDDLPYFKEHFGKLYDFEYSTNENEIDDLVEISCCHSHINSSSTFSWWGSWLNQNPEKVIITQRLWFQTGWRETGREVLTDDVVPLNWIKL